MIANAPPRPYGAWALSREPLGCLIPLHLVHLDSPHIKGKDAMRRKTEPRAAGDSLHPDAGWMQENRDLSKVPKQLRKHCVKPGQVLNPNGVNCHSGMERLWREMDRLEDNKRIRFFERVLEKALRNNRLLIFLLEKMLEPSEGAANAPHNPDISGAINSQFYVDRDPETAALVHEVLRRDRKRQLAAFGEHANPPH